jgi:peptidoglycan/LPS O-acetylase OafA/YrhL
LGRVPARADRFPLVDSLRAIAALSIVAYHVAPLAGALTDGFATAVAAQLSTGVALFFLISGFLLYRPFVLAHAAGHRLPDVRAYAWRRFLRIVPAYWAALTITGLLIAPEVFDRPLLFYGFVQIYSPGAVFEGIPLAWTLCIEVSFYAFLPLYAFLLRPASRRLGWSPWRVEGIAVIALFGFGVAWRTAGLTVDSHFLQSSLNTLPAYLAWFALGMGLAVTSAWLGEEAAKPRFVRFLERAPEVCWSVALAAFAANAWIWGRRYFGGEDSAAAMLGVHLTEALCALALLLPAVFGAEGRGRGLLAQPALLWLGLVSYGIYLWQAAALDAVGELTPLEADALDPSLWWLPVGFGACVVAGALSWYLLERWAMMLRGLVPPRSDRATAGADAAAARVAP